MVDKQEDEGSHDFQSLTTFTLMFTLLYTAKPGELMHILQLQIQLAHRIDRAIGVLDTIGITAAIAPI